jgi:hypothetical protein
MSIPAAPSRSEQELSPGALARAAVPVIVAVAAVGLALATLRHGPAVADASDAQVQARPASAQATPYSEMHGRIPQPASPEELPPQF